MGVAERDAPVGLAQPPRGGQDLAADVHSDDGAAAPDPRREIAQHHPAAAADFQHAIAAAHRHEAQEARAQSDLGRGGAAGLEPGDHGARVGLGVDRTPGIALGHGRGQPAKRLAQSGLQK